MNDSNSTALTDTSPRTFTTGGWRSHKILVVLFAIYMSDYADRSVVAGMLKYIMNDWHVTYEQGAWLVSVVILFITIFSIPASLLIDRWSRRKMVAIMTFLWSLATLASAFTRNYFQLIVTRAFIGIGEAGYAPGGSAMIAAAYPEKDRAKYMGIWNASIPVGMGIGLVTGGLIARYWGWHHAFGLISVPGMLLAVTAWYLPDYETVRLDETTASVGHRPGLLASMRKFFNQSSGLFRIPSLTYTYLGFAMNVSATTALLSLLPTYLEEAGKAPAGKGGLYASGLFALVLVGAPLGGFLSDAWYRTNKKARLIFPALTSVLASWLLYAGFLFIHRPAGYPLLAVFGIAVTCFVAPAAAVTQDVVHPGMRALSYSLCVIVQHVVGDVWSGPLIGRIADTSDLGTALLFTPAYCALAAMCFLVGSRFYARDLDKVAKVRLEAEQA